MGKTCPFSIWRSLIIAFALSGVIFAMTTPYMGLATLAYFFMLCGLYYRKTSLIHLRFMLAAVILDLALVLTLELQRSAIGTAVAQKLSWLQQFHIYFSTLALLFYFPTLYLAFRVYRKKLRGEDISKKRWHIRLGIAAFTLRTFGFVLMFSLLDYVKKSVE